MPELPEVETIRRALEAEVAGATIDAVQIGHPRAIRDQGPAGGRDDAALAFTRNLTGHTLQAAERAGKYLLLGMDGGYGLVVHLGMSGQLLLAAPGTPGQKHAHVVIGLADGRELRFVDPRTFGRLVSTPPAQPPRSLPCIARLGPDPLGPGFTNEVLAAALRPRRARLKPLLMDQRFVSGIGNIYSDEILFQAGLRYDAVAADLAEIEVETLREATVATLSWAVARGGSTLADAQYRDLHGRPGEFQDHHMVYAREGQACRRCGDVIAREKLAGRSTFYCPSCQAAPAGGAAVRPRARAS
ncbi:MAG: bifunctional DNA-formamidopyrimidine glycosylase/DNA-(apurinic or apyrimidinic site) lyase [Acidimicrobiales bacterium]